MRPSHRFRYALAAAALLLAAVSSVGVAGAHLRRGRYLADELLVRLQPGANPRAFALANGLKLSSDARDALPNQAIYRAKIADGSSPWQKVAQLAQSSDVLYSEPNSIGQIPEARLRSSWVVGGDDYEYANQWASSAIRLAKAHNVTRGAGVVVAILDTGVDRAHPMLADRLTDGYDFVDDDADPQEERSDGSSAFGHGTHVAGLVALAAPEARIMPLRTLDSAGMGTIWGQVRALRYAAEHGADVINLSYSFELPSRVLNDVLATISCAGGGDPSCASLDSPGAVVVAAAGNSGMKLREYPAADQAPGILGVGASRADDTLAVFSTYGAWVRVMAPGDHILSTVPGGGYASWSGTSMASPLVAGVAALVRAAYPTLRPSEVAARITTTSAQTTSLVRRRLDAAGAVGLGSSKLWQAP